MPDSIRQDQTLPFLPPQECAQGYQDVPEMKYKYTYKPFPAGVYSIGIMSLSLLKSKEYEGWEGHSVSRWVEETFTKLDYSLRPIATAAEALEDCNQIIKEHPKSELHKTMYPKDAYMIRGSRSLTELYYTARAVYMRQNKMENELFEGLVPVSKEVSTPPSKSLYGKLSSVLRVLFS